MMQTPLDIDRVVREVLAELKRAPASDIAAVSGATTNLRSVPGLSSSAENTVGQANRGTLDTSRNSELVLSTRLVTMAEIGDRLGGIRQVVVSPRAVVTPAVRDALRQRNITLSRDLPAATASASLPKMVVVAARTKLDPKLLADALKNEGLGVQCQWTDCSIDATDRLAGELTKGDSLGLLLTPHMAAALCLANRLAGVRAVLACDVGGVQAVVSAVGANLLIIDPKSVGLFKLCRMAGEFFRGGIRPCPEVFRKRLM